MTRLSPETPQKLDWFALALQEVQYIPALKERAEEYAGAVAEAITQRKEEIFSAGEKMMDFSSGNKNLRLIYVPYSEHATANSFIENIQGEDTLKHTTVLYIAAKIMLQSLANQNNTRVQYTFSTTKKRLIQWAEKIGRHLFHWGPSRKLYTLHEVNFFPQQPP